MHRPRQLRAPTHACVSPLGQWPEWRRQMAMEMALAPEKFPSISPFVVQCQRSAATNRAPAAVGKNTKIAAAALRNEIWKAAERRTPISIPLRRETPPDMTGQDDRGNS